MISAVTTNDQIPQFASVRSLLTQIKLVQRFRRDMPTLTEALAFVEGKGGF